MYTANNVVAIILARGGSKGILNKNLIVFLGKPLLVWTILQARYSNVISDIYVSSDSEKILEVAEQYGSIPIKRPLELATDTSSSELALLHALDVIKAQKGSDPELVIFLQVTSPLREPEDIKNALHIFNMQIADSLFSDAKLDDFCAWHEEAGVLQGKTFDPWNRGRRQDRKPLYLENGSIYIFRSELLRKTGNRLGGKIVRFTMPFWKSHEIDTIDELELCEFYFRKKLLAFWQNKQWDIDIQAVCLIVYDFDGVMTDNRALQLQDGTEAVFISRADGLGVAALRKLKISQVILSTERNAVVSARGKKLDIMVIQDCQDKKSALLDLCKIYQVSLESVLYVGNDLNDLEAMKIVGFPVAPADAHPAILIFAKYVTKAAGGCGVVRELSELFEERSSTTGLEIGGCVLGC